MNKTSNIYIYISGHKGLVGIAILGNLQDKGYQKLIYRSHDELDLTNTQELIFFKRKT